MEKQADIIYVNQRPYRIWSAASFPKEDTQIRNFDPYFHVRTAKLLASQLGSGVESDSASLGIRTMHGLATEAFFSLLFATLQAPDYPFAWVSLCRPEELVALVTSVKENKSFPHRFQFKEPSWLVIARTLLPLETHTAEENANANQVHSSFAESWAELSSDFLTDAYKQEFNALKHGFRLQSASPVVAFGKLSLPTAEHGSLFPVAIRHKNKSDVVFKMTTRSWSANSLLGTLDLIAWSMANLVSVLKVMHGIEEELELWIPSKEDFGRAKPPDSQLLTALSLGPSFNEKFNPEPLDKDYAKAFYEKKGRWIGPSSDSLVAEGVPGEVPSVSSSDDDASGSEGDQRRTKAPEPPTRTKMRG